MPCAALPRGKNDVKLPLRAGWAHDPCGCKIVNTIAGVDVSAQNLCIFHMTMKRGQSGMTAPVVQAP